MTKDRDNRNEILADDLDDRGPSHVAMRRLIVREVVRVEEEAAEEVDKSDLNGKSKAELVAMFAELLSTEPVQTIRKSVEAIKIAFYKQHRAEIDAARKAFEAQAEEGVEFVATPDADEQLLKDLSRSTVLAAMSISLIWRASRRRICKPSSHLSRSSRSWSIQTRL